MVTAVRGEHSPADKQPSTLGNAHMSREPIFVAGAAVAFAAGAAVAKRDTATGAGAMFTIYWSMLLLVVGFLMGRFSGRATAPEVEDAGLATEAAGGQPTLAPAAQPTAAQPTAAQQQAGGHDASGPRGSRPRSPQQRRRRHRHLPRHRLLSKRSQRSTSFSSRRTVIAGTQYGTASALGRRGQFSG